jgi:hypothetical protein
MPNPKKRRNPWHLSFLKQQHLCAGSTPFGATSGSMNCLIGKQFNRCNA